MRSRGFTPSVAMGTTPSGIVFCFVANPPVADIRSKCLLPEQIQAVQHFEEHDFMGWTFTDAMAWPGPVDGELHHHAILEQFYAEFSVWCPVDEVRFKIAIAEVDPEAKLFTDGSLLDDLWPTAARAGWGSWWLLHPPLLCELLGQFLVRYRPFLQPSGRLLKWLHVFGRGAGPIQWGTASTLCAPWPHLCRPVDL